MLTNPRRSFTTFVMVRTESRIPLNHLPKGWKLGKILEAEVKPSNPC